MKMNFVYIFIVNFAFRKSRYIKDFFGRSKTNEKSDSHFIIGSTFGVCDSDQRHDGKRRNF